MGTILLYLEHRSLWWHK